MDKFLLKSFNSSLISIFKDLVVPLNLQLFILSIWKKATSNVQLMRDNIKTARSLVDVCLAVSRKSTRLIALDKEMIRDFNRYRFKILQHLANSQIRIFVLYDFDKYALAGLIVENLNEYPCSPVDLKNIMEMFKISNLNMHSKEFPGLFEAAQTNSAFNFLWVTFWIGAEVEFYYRVFTEQESQQFHREMG
jgi:hypothetical protein